MKRTLFLIGVFAAVLASCTKPAGYGELCVKIDYSINDKALITDSLCYTNEAGNTFMITEIQWFLSRIELQDEHGDWTQLEPHYFYIDTNIPENQQFKSSSIPVGKYKALRFNFGLNEDDNQSGLFNDPPEANMFWPEPLGGGYHYMKLNGKYLDENEQLAPLNIHLGIGQNADHTQFYQNYFTVELPIDFTIKESTETQLYLTMIVDNWFRNPNLYDFNEYGSAIMQNQAAQQALKENGHDVFNVEQNPENQNTISMTVLEKFNKTLQKATPKPHFWTWNNVKHNLEQIKESSKNRS